MGNIIKRGLAILGLLIIPMFMIWKSKAKGHRNNNPFNLVKSNNEWIGKVESSDPIFEQFSTLELGIRAGYINLINGYKNKRIYDTPYTLINKYCPVGVHGNSQKAVTNYYESLAKYLGIGVHDTIKDWKKAAYYIMKHENGYEIMSYQAFQDILKKYKL